MIVIRPERLSVKSGDQHRLALMSDLHIGSRSADYARIKSDLERCRKEGRRIGINGDVFDLILPGDRKRFRLSDVHPRLFENGDDMVGAAVDWAVEILSPYADLIEFIGDGNHDDGGLKYHGVDLIRCLIVRLNDKTGSRIEYGGYCGWWQIRFNLNTIRLSYNIQYHHGSGGASPVTKGMIGFNRAQTWIEGADATWRGHKHWKTADRGVKQCIGDDGIVRHREYLNIMSGAYLLAYDQQDTKEALDKGRRTNYACLWDVAPQPHGAVFLDLTIHRDGIKAEARI